MPGPKGLVKCLRCGRYHDPHRQQWLERAQLCHSCFQHLNAFPETAMAQEACPHCSLTPDEAERLEFLAWRLEHGQVHEFNGEAGNLDVDLDAES